MSLGNTSIHQRGEIPEIAKLPNGRIRVIRRFQKFTREDVDNENLGSLMGDFGDLDTAGEQVANQGYTDCRLISVEVDSGYSSVSNTDKPVLVKTYETLTDSFVQITDDTVTFTESGLKQITRVYRAVSGTTSLNVVGTTTLTSGETLASSSIEDNGAFAELTETYVEAGVLSISESHRYGDSVEVYSVEGIKLTQGEARAAITDLPEDAKFYGLRLSNYEGLQTTLYEFFTGSGVISTSISYSYNNKLTRTTIVSIDETPDTPVGSVLIDSKAEARDEFILYTYTFVEGQGIVSTNSSSKYNGELTVTTVTSINEVPVVPVGSTTIEAQVREEDGYLLYTTTYASGAGVIGVSTDTKYDGKLTLTTTTSLNQPPTGITNLIRSESSQSDYGTIYTYTTAVGTGEIGRSVDYKYDNTLTLTTVTSINVVPDEDGALVRSDVSDTDYGTIYTYTFATGTGEIGRSTDSKYGGKLNLITVTSLDVVPDEDGAVIRSDLNQTDYGTIYTYTFAQGSGIIGTSTDYKYDNALTLTTVTTLNQTPVGTGALVRSDVSDTDYGTIYTYTYASGSGEIGRSIDYKYNNTLTLTTVTSLNTVPNEDGAVIRSDSSDTDYGTIYTYTFATGSGQIGTSTDIKYGGTLTLTTITSLNQTPSGTGALIRSDVNDTDYGTIYTYTYASGEGQIGESIDYKYNNTLTLTTVTALNQIPTGIGAVIRSDSNYTEYGTIYTYTFATGSGVIGTSTDSKYNNTLTLTTVTSLNEVPDGEGALIRSDASDTDYGTIYTYTYASGVGVIGTSTDKKYNNTLTLTTVTSLNEVPTGTGALIRSDQNDTDYGTIYTYTYATGEGQIGSSTDYKYDNALTLTTITSLNQVPSGTGAVIRSDSNETDYGTIYTYTFASGQGQIGESIENKYNGTLTLTTLTSLNVVPVGTGALIRSDSNDTDYGTIYTYTYAQGQGEIGRSTDKKYNDTVTLITVTNLNAIPDEDGYLFKSDTRETDYGTIYTYTYAQGEGEISRDESIRYQGKLKILSITYLNEANPVTPAGYTLIRSENNSSDFGIILTQTYAEGIGEISSSKETRSDGSEINSYTILGDQEPVPPANSYLIEKSYEAADGYDIYTYFYYSLPTNYEVPVSTTWKKPSTLAWNAGSGFYIGDTGGIQSAVGRSVVTFSTTQPSPLSLTNIDITAVSNESVSYKDGSRLVRTSTWENTVSNGVGGAVGGGSYLGGECLSGSATSSSASMPSGTITVGWESVPYFYAGGITVYKTTTTTIDV